MKFGVCVLFGNPFEDIQNSLKCEKNNRYFIFSLFEIFLILPRMRNIKKNCIQKPKHILSSIIFVSTIVPCMEYVGKYCRVGQDTNDNMAHAYRMLDN